MTGTAMQIEQLWNGGAEYVPPQIHTRPEEKPRQIVAHLAR